MSQAKSLVAYLNECDRAYYVNGNPIVSNETYEALVESLRKIDPENSYLSKVGTKFQGNGKKVARLIPMGTLSKYNKEEDVLKWMETQPVTEFIIAPKYDGFACELEYVNGELRMASTRGDGIVGEDVTEAARKRVPLTIPREDLRVRGEFIISKQHHAKLKELGYTAMRNAVPGIVRSNSEAMRYVDFVAYEFFGDGLDDRIYQRMLYSGYFNVEMASTTTDFKDIVEIRQGWIDSNREAFRYEVDGLVLKTNKILPDDMSHPKHMISWKFKSNREATILRGIRVQMGITGRFSPVGEFDVVEFQGAKLTSASLGNFSRIADMTSKEENPLMIGSTIEVSRRGDIIPYIEECTYTPTDGEPEKIQLIEVCPHCKEDVVWKGDEPYCDNNSCPRLLELRLSQYIAGTGMKGIGGAIVSKLAGTKIHTLADIYRLDPKDIMAIPGFGATAAVKWDTLQKKELSPYQFTGALPFTDIGPAVWKQLLDKMSFYEVLELTEDELLKMDLKRFGEGKRRDFIAQRDSLKDEILDLLNYVKL